MAAYLRFREQFRKPEDLLHRIGLQDGQTVLDYGCGIGSYAIPAARIVGATGKVHALDIHPIAVERVQKRAKKEGLSNIVTIQSGLDTGLEDESIDFVLLFDVFTWVHEKEELLKELHRVLKNTGTFSVIIDHVDPIEFRKIIEKTALFEITSQEDNFFILRKASN